MLRDKKSKMTNIVHYMSSKSKLFCSSSLTAELLAMVEGFNVGFTLRCTLHNLTGRNVEYVLVTDSKSGYVLVMTLAQTTERRLQIDLEMFREAYEKRDLKSVSKRFQHKCEKRY